MTPSDLDDLRTQIKILRNAAIALKLAVRGANFERAPEREALLELAEDVAHQAAVIFEEAPLISTTRETTREPD